MALGHILLVLVALALSAGVYACHRTTNQLRVILTEVFGSVSRAPVFLRDGKNWISYRGTLVPEVAFRLYPQVRGNPLTMLLLHRIVALYAWKGYIDDEVVAVLMKYIGEMQGRKTCTFQIIGPDNINVEHNWFIGPTEGLSPEELVMAICAYNLALVSPAKRVFAAVPEILVDLSEGWEKPKDVDYVSDNAKKETAFRRAVAFFKSVEEKDISPDTIMNCVRVLEKLASTLTGGIVCSVETANLGRNWGKHVGKMVHAEKQRLIASGTPGKEMGRLIGEFAKAIKEQKPKPKIGDNPLEKNLAALNLSAFILAFCLAHQKRDRENNQTGKDAEAEMQAFLLKAYSSGVEFNAKRHVVVDEDGNTKLVEFDATFRGMSIECKATMAGALHSFAKGQASMMYKEYRCVAIYVCGEGFFRVSYDKDGKRLFGPKIDVTEVFSV
jgi:hypothetical protein